MTTVITRTTARTVLPIVFLLAVALFVQGHNLPGGGFIGGVLTVAAFALVYIAYDADYIEQTVLDRRDHAGAVADYRLLFAVGLAVAAAGGLVPVLFGRPFLTQGVLIVHGVPLYGEVELASAIVFDLGVYLVVVGALLTVLSEVGEE